MLIPTTYSGFYSVKFYFELNYFCFQRRFIIHYVCITCKRQYTVYSINSLNAVINHPRSSNIKILYIWLFWAKQSLNFVLIRIFPTNIEFLCRVYT